MCKPNNEEGQMSNDSNPSSAIYKVVSKLYYCIEEHNGDGTTIALNSNQCKTLLNIIEKDTRSIVNELRKHVARKGTPVKHTNKGIAGSNYR